MRNFAYVILMVLFTGCTSSGPGKLGKGSLNESTYYPLPDSMGGWRKLIDARKIRRYTGIDKIMLDSAYNYTRTTTKNGGLLVIRHGYLVYEKYFGRGQRDAMPNLASCGKSFTSIAFGILMGEHPENFPDGLDQKIFTPLYLPEKAFPLSDPQMAGIKLGNLLSFTAGIRGDNPVYINGAASTTDTVSPEGWYATVDDYALGKKDRVINGKTLTTKSLWCQPGGGYMYSTAAIHIASIIVRHIAGMELEDYIQIHLAKPMGWDEWGFGFHNQPLVDHTPGGGGIVLRSTDMLRFCYLLLHEGMWGNKQIVPKNYVDKATTASPYNRHFPFSLQFRVNTNKDIKELPSDTFWKPGAGGHCFYVVPSLDLIVWKLGGNDEQYSQANTGFPEPLKTSQVIQPIIEGQDHNPGNDVIKVLELVLRSIVNERNDL